MPSVDPTNHDAQRRAILRGIVGVGWVCCVSAVSGCGRKEPPVPAEKPPATTPTPAPPQAPAAPAAGEPAPGAGSQTGQAPAAPKVTKAQVQYQEQPKGAQKCSNCQHFAAASNTCQLVEGNINPEGWCSLWAAKPT